VIDTLDELFEMEIVQKWGGVAHVWVCVKKGMSGTRLFYAHVSILTSVIGS